MARSRATETADAHLKASPGQPASRIPTTLARKQLGALRRAFVTDDTYLTTIDLCARYRIQARTLSRLHALGEGPPALRLSPRRVVYRLADAEAWAASRETAARRKPETAAEKAE